MFGHKPAGNENKIVILLGKGQGLARVAPQPLAERVVPTLLMSSQTSGFARRKVLIGRQKQGIGFPMVGVTRISLVGIWHRLPHEAASVLRTIPDGIRHDLKGAATLGGPQPAFEPFFAHEADQFIHFQHIARFHRQQGIGQGWHLSHIVLQPAQVHAFTIRSQNLGFIPSRITFFRSKHTVHPAIAAMVLSIPTFIPSIAYNIGAAA